MSVPQSTIDYAFGVGWHHWREPLVIYDGAVRIEYQPPPRKQAVVLDGYFRVVQTEPMARIEWRMSRGQLIRIAWRCLRAAMSWA